MDIEATKIFRAFEKKALIELAKEWLRSQNDGSNLLKNASKL